MDISKCKEIINLALKEDVGLGDITANLIREDKIVRAKIITRQDAVVCGRDFVDMVFHQLDPDIIITWKVNDGNSVIKNQDICYLNGLAKPLLTGERCALNFLQTLSGTATLTKKFVEIVQGTGVVLLDTRKTIPGLRLAQKYAVICGGGQNHRMGLYDAFLIKENHIEACGSITNAVTLARQHDSEKVVEVEVKNIEEFKEALLLKVNIIMLDNFSLDEIKKAVALNSGSAKIEVSGGVNLESIAKIAATGVDYISVGALTKNIESVDFSMLFI